LAVDQNQCGAPGRDPVGPDHAKAPRSRGKISRPASLRLAA
jgi:hypothetical protein